jgi:hypothetical protein
MFTINHIIQHEVKGYGGCAEKRSQISRCICLPFDSSDDDTIECRKSNKDACIMIKSAKEKKIHKIYAREMHVVDHVVENICEIKFKKIEQPEVPNSNMMDLMGCDDDEEDGNGSRKRKNSLESNSNSKKKAKLSSASSERRCVCVR